MNRRSALKAIGASTLTLLGLGASDVTTPIQHGFPDWNRSVAAADIQIVNSLGLNLTGLTLTNVFFVGHMPYMYIRISSTNSAQVGISWFADAAATVSLFGDVIATAVGGAGIQCIPVRGPYVRFTLERGAYPGTVNFQAFMVPSLFNVYSGTEGENVLISVDNAAIAGGTAVTTDATETRGGWITWDASIYDRTPIYTRLYAVSFSGVATLLDFNYHPTNTTSRLVFAPALPLRVIVQEQTGVGSTYSATVTHHPFYP